MFKLFSISNSARPLGPVVTYMSDQETLGLIADSTVRFFSNGELIPGMYRLCFCGFQYPLFMFCPILHSEDTFALFWPQDIRGPPIVHVMIDVVHRIFQKTLALSKWYKENLKKKKKKEQTDIWFQSTCIIRNNIWTILKLTCIMCLNIMY